LEKSFNRGGVVGGILLAKAKITVESTPKEIINHDEDANGIGD